MLNLFVFLLGVLGNVWALYWRRTYLEEVMVKGDWTRIATCSPVLGGWENTHLLVSNDIPRDGSVESFICSMSDPTA